MLVILLADFLALFIALTLVTLLVFILGGFRPLQDVIDLGTGVSDSLDRLSDRPLQSTHVHDHVKLSLAIVLRDVVARIG